MEMEGKERRASKIDVTPLESPQFVSCPEEFQRLWANVRQQIMAQHPAKWVPITGEIRCEDLDPDNLRPGSWKPITGETSEERKKLVIECKAARTANQRSTAIDDETAQTLINSGRVSECRAGYKLPVCFFTGDNL